jgi:hypothetical protein
VARHDWVEIAPTDCELIRYGGGRIALTLKVLSDSGASCFRYMHKVDVFDFFRYAAGQVCPAV